MAHGRPGPAPQTAKREQFARLIGRSISNAEACRIVGVNPRTGNAGDTGAQSSAAAWPCYRTAEDALMRSAALGACWTPA